MAEFCLECWNKLNDESNTEDSCTLSDDLDFCEGCGEMKRVFVSYQRPSFWKRHFSKQKKQ